MEVSILHAHPGRRPEREHLDSLNAAVDAASTSAAALTQRANLEQQLAGMDARLDQVMAAMSSSTGAQRSDALAAVVRELASQITVMRQALLASGSSSFDTASDPGQTIFITPSGSVVQARERCVNGLEQPPTAGAAATGATRIEQSSTSGLTTQAQSRRTGDSGEPATTP
jgi:hypothetical protein